MSKVSSPVWSTKPGSDEFRLDKVDGTTTVDVGQPARFKGRLGPGWRAEKWGGLGWMAICSGDVKVNKPGSLKNDEKRGHVYECECLRSVKGRDRAERHIIVPGSTEYQIEWDTLADVPDTGYVDLLLEFSGELTWHKQLALTQAEIDAGDERPENVVNSYAVYGARSGRLCKSNGREITNYETGKFCHLYRSRLIDAKGNQRWIDQTAPMTNPNQLRLHLDGDWLRGAVFPVVLDPTFGYASIGASVSNFGGAAVGSGLFGPGVAATVASVSVYSGSSSSSQYTAGVYAGTATDPGALLRDGPGGNGAGAVGWQTQALDSALEVGAADQVWLAAHFGSTWFARYDSGTAYNSAHKFSTYSHGVLNNPFVAGYAKVAGRVYSIYATYTAASDSTPDAFDFTDVTDADPSTVYISDSQEITGMDAGTAISITGGEYRINGGTWTSDAGTIDPGDTLELRGTSSADSEGVVTVTVTVGTLAVDWTITTGVLSSVVSNIVGSAILNSRIFRSRIVSGHV